MLHKDKIILKKIISVIDDATEILQNVSKEEFLEKSLYKMAMGMSIIRVGELVKNLDFETRKNNPQIAWRDITGFRDVFAHRYDVMDFERVYISIKYEFPELKLQIEKILAEEDLN